MVIDFRRNANPPPPAIIKGTPVKRVESNVYLGVTLNNDLSWGEHIDTLVKKLNSRLYCLRKMSNFNVRSEILEMFYNATICGVWRYCLICWGGNVVNSERDRIDGIRKKAEEVIGTSQPTVDEVYQCLLQSKLDTVWGDSAHPLHDHLHDSCMSRGSGRLRLPCLKTNRHRNSFIPCAIQLFNSNLKR